MIRRIAESRITTWVVVVVLVVCAFSAGRFSAPAEVDVRTDIQIRYKDRIVEKWHKAKDRIVYVETTRTPDGTVVEKRSEKEITNESSHTVSDRDAVETKRTATATKALPDWRIGVLVGGSLVSEPALPIAGRLVIGASVERRIIGGVSLGAWGNTMGAVGGSLSVEF